MDAVEYLKARERFFKACGVESGHFQSELDRPEDTVAFVEKWSREHPVVTNAQKFEEVFGCFSPVHGLPHLPNTWWDEPYKEPEGKE